MNSKKINVCVFCGSTLGKNRIYKDEIKKLGLSISQNSWNLIYGGGNLGLMGILANEFDRKKAEIISVIPKTLDKKEILFLKPSRRVIVKDLYERKKKMINVADFFIVFPVGIGTLDELLDIISLNYLSIKNKKVIILNLNNYWDPLKDLFSHMNTSGFINNIKSCNMYFITTVDKTIEFIKNNL